MSTPPPTTLGQYQIIREIARSNDIVYEAYDPQMNRRVAVKEMAVPQGMSEAQRQERIHRFKREAQAAGTLNHANIMTVYSFAEESGRHFMAMEYLDGVTLRNEIDTKGALPSDRAVEIATAVLEGLGHAHSKGVIHRDIKPDNIQLLSNGGIKITDFGIARLTFQPNLTMDGQVFGTPSYMSPEQVVGREIDARSDLFSVGVLLYEMIDGKKPFAGDSVVSITYAIMNKEPDMPAAASYPLWQVIQRALDKSPQLRFRDANEMMAALGEAIHQSEPQVAPAPLNLYGSPAPQSQSYPSPPIAYPYNPYAPGAASSPVPPPIQPGGFVPPSAYPPGYAQAPIYYPPPPRVPLFKPETVLFARRVIITTIIVGTFFLLVVVGIIELSKALQEYNAERHDGEAVTVVVRDPNLDLDEKIRRLEQLTSKVSSQAARQSAKRNLATLYDQRGMKLVNGDVVETIDAERSFKNAIDNNATEPSYYVNLAELYGRKALQQADAEQRQTLLAESAKLWQEASEKEANPEIAGRYAQSALTMYTNFVSAVESGGGTRREIRDVLYSARASSDANSLLARELDRLLAAYR